jgi:hypothetical protein
VFSIVNRHILGSLTRDKEHPKRRQQLPPIAVIQERKLGNTYVPTILTDCKEKYV